MILQIIFARAYTHEHQYQLLVALAAKMAEEPFRLLVRSAACFPALLNKRLLEQGQIAETGNN